MMKYAFIKYYENRKRKEANSIRKARKENNNGQTMKSLQLKINHKGITRALYLSYLLVNVIHFLV